MFIQVDANGQCINHPALESNLLQALGRVPENWEPFVRVEQPVLGVYEVLESEQPTYQKIDGVWTDVWDIRQMTETEKLEKQNATKDAWANRPYASNWSAWTFDEATCNYIPPIPRPEPIEGKQFWWCGADNSWKEPPPYPDDGKQYEFNFIDWVWFEVPA